MFTRPPGFATFNPFTWPVIERKPLSFYGYGDRHDVWNEADARAAMEQASLEFWGEALTEPTSYLLVFREIDGACWRAVIDLD